MTDQASSVRTTPPLRVLVADDTDFFRKVTGEALEEAGFVVTLASDGEVALAKAQKEDHDVILVDLIMPGLDGFEVIKAIREKETGKRAIILAMTAVVDELEEIHRLKTLGADGYIRKSKSPDEIVFRVQQALEESGASDR